MLVNLAPGVTGVDGPVLVTMISTEAESPSSESTTPARAALAVNIMFQFTGTQIAIVYVSSLSAVFKVRFRNLGVCGSA